MNTWFEVSRSYPYIKEFRPDGRTSNTCCIFDPLSECCWTGNDQGRVQSFMVPGLERYSVFRTHMIGSVKDLAVLNEEVIISLGVRSLRWNNKRGLGLSLLAADEEDANVHFNCFSRLYGSGNQLLLSGFAMNEFWLIDAVRGSLVQKLRVDEPLNTIQMKTFRSLICCAESNGCVVVRDQFKRYKTEFVVEAHNGISSIEVSDHYLVTCGYSNRQGQLFPDPIMKVYDLRSLKGMIPVAVHQGITLIKKHPIIPSKLYAMSPNGYFGSCDLGTMMFSPTGYQMEVNDACTAFDVSSTGKMVVAVDASGGVHLWSNAEDSMVNDFSVPLQLPNSQNNTIELGEDDPLSIIGMPFYDEPLLSNWQYDITFNIGKPLVSIPDEILAAMQIKEFVGVAPNPGTFRRNQNYRRSSVPKFRSEQERDGDQVNADSAKRDLDPTGITMPKPYRKVEIRYSRFGVEDFDFGFYNKTHYGGLETHLRNSYLNSLIQMLYFSIPFKNTVLKHMYDSDCRETSCLSCELAFLFKMLDDSKGKNCHATNFLATFYRLSKTNQLNLVEEEENQLTDCYDKKIQQCQEFLFNKVFEEVAEPFSFITSSVSYLVQCEKCRTEDCVNYSKFNFVTLSYENRNYNNFVDLLIASILPPMNNDLVRCQKHKKMVRSKRYLFKPAEVLNIHCNIQNESDLNHWRQASYNLFDSPHTQSWLPFRFAMRVDYLDIFKTQIKSLGMDEFIEDDDGSWAIYDLKVGDLFNSQIQSSITQIVDDLHKRKKSHLVAHVKVPRKLEEEDSPDTAFSHSEHFRWYLFNDFVVSARPWYEVVQYSSLWKVPVILSYRRIRDNVNDHCQLPLFNRSILLENTCLNKPSVMVDAQLTQEEVSSIQPGYLVAIDAEFVLLEQKEYEIRSDGTRQIVRPERLALGRLTLVRGQGPLKGKSFLDDYVYIEEPIVDYLTQYSGLHPGDLDPEKSKFCLSHLKSVYKKLRLLIDMGCKFIGHGLKKDLRTIDIVIPSNQLIDTVDLFHVRNKRRIALRFLAWYLLGKKIQVKEHSSLEDSLAALHVYEKYLELKANGEFEKVLDNIYKNGRDTLWTVK